jgi:hypothetical protein
MLGVMGDLGVALLRFDAVPVTGWATMLALDGDHPEQDRNRDDHNGAQSDELDVHGCLSPATPAAVLAEQATARPAEAAVAVRRLCLAAAVALLAPLVS